MGKSFKALKRAMDNRKEFVQREMLAPVDAINKPFKSLQLRGTAWLKTGDQEFSCYNGGSASAL